MVDEYLDAAALYHALIFSYELGISHTAHLDKRLASLKLMYPFLDEMSKDLPFGKVTEGDPEKTLREYGDRLVDLSLAGRVDVEPTGDGGYTFTVSNCILAGDLHKRFNATDVVCPLAVYAQFLAEKSGVGSVKENPSVFDEHGSSTKIDFKDKVKPAILEPPSQDITRWVKLINENRERREAALK